MKPAGYVAMHVDAVIKMARDGIQTIEKERDRQREVLIQLVMKPTRFLRRTKTREQAIHFLKTQCVLGGNDWDWIKFYCEGAHENCRNLIAAAKLSDEDTMWISAETASMLRSLCVNDEDDVV